MDPGARKGRVADVALGCFRSRGFALTSLADVARAANLDDADVGALFGDKEGLMSELVSPLLSRLGEVVAAAAVADLTQHRQLRNVIEGYLDTLVAHRLLVGIILGDPTAASNESVRLVRATMSCLRDQLAAGTGSDPERGIRAAAALGAMQAAALELTDIDPTTVRHVIADAAMAILLT